MLDHISIYVSDYDKAKNFYQAALAPLGYKVAQEFKEWSVAGFSSSDSSDFWIGQREAAERAHVAFRADSKEAVDDFHAAALSAGGKDNGAPGYRKDYSPGYYAAFVLDPDGSNIEVVFHDPAMGA